MNLSSIAISAISLLALTQQAQASWTTYIDCNNRELVIDRDYSRNSSGSPAHQLVLTGPALNYFMQEGAVSKVNSKGEFILTIFEYDSELKGWIITGENDGRSPIQYREFYISKSAYNHGDVNIRTHGNSGSINWQFHACTINN